jgi:hypothetical protein
MMRRGKPQGIAVTSARAAEKNPDTPQRTLKFEANRRWRFCRCIGTAEGDKCRVIGDLSGSEV